MASVDNDDFIDIELDDEADSAPGPDVIEVTFDDRPPKAAPPAVPPPRARRPDRPDSASPPAAPGLPMVAAGVCARCGYALRPLEDVCPRCQTPAGEAVEEPAAKAPTHHTPESSGLPPALDTPTAPPSRRNWLGALAGVTLFVILAVGVPLYLWMQPAQRAKREYQAGLGAQLGGDFAGARDHYRRALEFNPQMGLAAFSLGTTYLGIGDPAVVDSVKKITEKAIWGQTEELDEADHWFQQAATIGERLPPSGRLMDQRISTPARLRAFARACLALTALIRASAATQADQLEDAMSWFQVATQQAQAAIIDDPGNDAANQILRASAGFGPSTQAIGP